MKKFLITLGIILFFLVCISVFKDLAIKSIVTKAVTDALGAPVRMDSFSLNVFSSTIHISGLKIDNPSSFPPGMLVSCPEITIVYDRDSFLKHKPHLLMVDIKLKDMNLTKNKKGKLSVDSLKIVRQSKSAPSTPVKIDFLNLSIGQIIYTDYTAGTHPSVQVYDINRHKSYKGVPNTRQLAVLVLTESMRAAAIRNAEIYGVAALAGTAVLPVAVAATFIGRDNVQETIDTSFNRVYEVSLEVIRNMGTVTGQDITHGEVKANLNGTEVIVKLWKISANKTKISISGRKYMLPEPSIAGGVLYQILDKLQ